MPCIRIRNLFCIHNTSVVGEGSKPPIIIIIIIIIIILFYYPIVHEAQKK